MREREEGEGEVVLINDIVGLFFFNVKGNEMWGKREKMERRKGEERVASFCVCVGVRVSVGLCLCVGYQCVVNNCCP